MQATELATAGKKNWSVQSVATSASSAAAIDVSSAQIIGMHLSGEIYFNFSTSSSAAVSTANDLKLGQGLTFLAVPRFVTDAKERAGSAKDSVYLHHQRTGSSDVTMRLVFC
tara:strand:- start:79 stop:414 length:336 start_codon:yes stop_codon:yes gene_type:complete